MTENNNRRRERVPFEIEAFFTCDSKKSTCSCENISMSGVLVESDEFFSVGSTGSVLIILHSGTEVLEVKGECHVARVIPTESGVFQLGLEFDSLDTESSIVLYNMVRYQKS